VNTLSTLSISTKVFLAFAVVLSVFASVLVYGVLRIQRVSQDNQLIHHCYVPLSLVLNEAHTDLASYEAVLNEQDKSVLRKVVLAQKVLAPFAARAAAKLARAHEFVEIGLDLQGGSNPFLERGQSDIDELRAQIEDFQAVTTRFREAVLSESWDQAFAHQKRLRGIIDSMQEVLRELTRTTRIEIGDAIGRTGSSERDALGGIVLLSAVAICIGLAVMFIVHLTLRPIGELTEAAKHVGAGEYSGRVKISRRDEVGKLAEEFNRMAEKIELRDRSLRDRRDELEAAYQALVELRQQEERTKAELIKKERLAAIGRMTSQVTHELRNPLSSLGLNVEMLDEELTILGASDGSEAKELIGAITDEVERLTGITEEYLAYARLPVAKLRPTLINTILEDLLAFMSEELSQREIVTTSKLATNLPQVQADPNQLRRAFLNLIRNAVDAMEGGGLLALSSWSEGNTVIVELHDSGPGIPEDELQHIFEPFYSTKESGTGLGLPLTSQIIEEHGGRILAASTIGRGSLFRIELPT